MDELLARTMVETLSKGIDPLSGRALPESHLCCNEEVQKALETVLAKCTIESNEQLLKRLRDEKRAKREEYAAYNAARFENQGAPWTREEEETLLSLNRRCNVWKIANIMGRSPKAIVNHLRLLGAAPNKARQAKVLPENAGKLWSSEEEALLSQMYDRKCSPNEICARLKRTRGSVLSRLRKLGKISDGEVW